MALTINMFLLSLMLPVLSSAQAPFTSITDIWSKSKISMMPDATSFVGTGNIIKAMAYMPGPNVKPQSRKKDPRVEKSFCDRDYKMLCPENFVNIGPVKDDDKLYCTSTSDYSGPCDGAYAFEGMSAFAKQQWSDNCLASWPCKRCTRDYRVPCPQGWEHENGASCRPMASYDGPCKMTFDFSSYNEAMREAWSNECDAFWTCFAEKRQSPQNTIVALRSRENARKVRPLSFLATKSIPVDGYKIRNSLFLTQPMREPEQASVNVIMQEDLARRQEESKYKGMEDQTQQLEQHIKATLAALVEH